jgi:hypothetical protein
MFKNKYLKYKHKYLHLKDILEGGDIISEKALKEAKEFTEFKDLVPKFTIGDIFIRFPKFKNKKEAIMYIIEQKKNGIEIKKEEKELGLTLEHASSELRDVIEIVLAAVNQNGDELQFASNKLKGNEKVIDAAFKQKASSLQYANREGTLEFMKKNGNSLEFVSNILKGDRHIVAAAFNQNPSSLQHATKDGTIEMVSKNGLTLQHANITLQADIDVVLAAVKQNADALQYASNLLQNDKAVLFSIIKTDHKNFNKLTQNQKNILLTPNGNNCIPTEINSTEFSALVNKGKMIFGKLSVCK